MKIHIKAVAERSPKSNKPLFELYFNDDYEGTMSECTLDTESLNLTGVDSHDI